MRKAEQGNKPCPAFNSVGIEVFSNDFATVDFREELCYHSRPKKAKFGEGKSIIRKTESMERWESKSAKRKRKRRGKAAADPERVSGDGSAPRRAFRPANEFHVFVAFVR